MSRNKSYVILIDEGYGVGVEVWTGEKKAKKRAKELFENKIKAYGEENYTDIERDIENDKYKAYDSDNNHIKIELISVFNKI
ncbi:MAG: hypothetical protein ACLTDM_15150 [Clostridium butyricum]